MVKKIVNKITAILMIAGIGLMPAAWLVSNMEWNENNTAYATADEIYYTEFCPECVTEG